MKILVDKKPRYYYVEDDCLFAKRTGEAIGGKDYSYINECICKISGRTCELQLYDECPYLKENENAEKIDRYRVVEQ